MSNLYFLDRLYPLTTKTILILLLLLPLLSCSKRVSIGDSNDQIFISDPYLKIKDYNNYEWELGTTQKAKVTRDIRVILNYPPLGSQNLQKIQKKYPVNSWLLRVKKYVNTQGESLLGYTVIPFNDQDQENFLFLSFSNKISIRIDYDASYPTYYTSKYPCPPTSHNKLVKDIFIEENDQITKTQFLVYPIYGNLIDPRKVAKTSPMILAEFNGGNVLTGKYYFDFALFDRKGSIIYTDFIPSENVLVIKKEQEVSYNGCENYSLPSNYQDESFRILNIND